MTYVLIASSQKKTKQAITISQQISESELMKALNSHVWGRTWADSKMFLPAGSFGKFAGYSGL